MALAAFDTHSFVKRLTKAGMPVEQAEALSEEQTLLITDRLATKEDLALLGKDIRREISDLRKDMDAKFAGVDAKLASMEERFDAKHESLRKDISHEIRELESRLMVKLGGLVVAGIVVIAALPAIFKYLHVS